MVLYGDVYDEACAYALELAEKEGYTFIHPFDDPAVATGQGTIAMEIIKELPLVDYILVPIGGGGLATGVSTPVSYTHLDVYKRQDWQVTLRQTEGSTASSIRRSRQRDASAARSRTFRKSRSVWQLAE